MEPRSAERGNARWAPTIRDVKLASMEPRSAERGNLIKRNNDYRKGTASMEPRSAERGNRAGAGRYFGGTGASMEPRSAERGNNFLSCSSLRVSLVLQWSHAQPNVETCRSRSGFAGLPAEASMEPRSAERGNKQESRRFQRWECASMEPRSAERGNPFGCSFHTIRRLASMEPRSAERGNKPFAIGFSRHLQRFNGATLSRTWKPVLRYSPVSGNALQWSHAQPNVETSSGIADSSVQPGLQWSHAQPNVETRGMTYLNSAKKRASMEPRSAERGNA